MAQEDLKGENIGVPEKGPQFIDHSIVCQIIISFFADTGLTKECVLLNQIPLILNYIPALVNELL